MLAHTLFGSNTNDSLGQGPLPLTQTDDVQLLPWSEALSLCQPLQFMSWLAACMPTCQIHTSKLDNIGRCGLQHITLMVTLTLIDYQSKIAK